MAERSGELSLQTRIDQRGWLIVPLQVGVNITLNLVLDTGFPVTRLSTGTRDLLDAFGFLLQELQAEGQELPDIEVRVSRPVTLLGVEGMLGLNFLTQFTEVRFHRPSLRLTLLR